MRRPEFIARQSSCPTGFLGRLIGHIMERETAAVNDAALTLLDLEAHDRVLEVGFGHGRTIDVIRAGGRLVLGFRPGGNRGAEDFPASVYSFHTSEQVGQMLLQAGFDVDEPPLAIGEVLLVTARRRASV